MTVKYWARAWASGLFDALCGFILQGALSSAEKLCTMHPHAEIQPSKIGWKLLFHQTFIIQLLAMRMHGTQWPSHWTSIVWCHKWQLKYCDSVLGQFSGAWVHGVKRILLTLIHYYLLLLKGYETMFCPSVKAVFVCVVPNVHY